MLIQQSIVAGAQFAGHQIFFFDFFAAGIIGMQTVSRAATVIDVKGEISAATINGNVVFVAG